MLKTAFLLTLISYQFSTSKSSKNYRLTIEDKKENQEKTSKRIFVEHINAKTND